MASYAKRVLLSSNGDELSASIAFSLAEVGCRLVLMGNKKRLTAIAERINNFMKDEKRVEVVGLDMEDDREATFDSSVEKACNLMGNIDAFVNCYLYEGKMQDPFMVSEDEFKKVLKVNFSAVWFLVKAVARRIRDQKTGGSIVLMTTIVGSERGLYQGAAAYGSCLAGVNQLVELTALEFGKYKIRVNGVIRGLHPDDEFPKFVGRQRAQALVGDVVPLQRWLDVKKDVNSTIMYLVNDESRYMTGTLNYVDGGQSISRPRMRSYM